MQAYEEFQREKKMVDGIIAKIMEEERQEQLEKMKKRNESVEMMRQVCRALPLLPPARPCACSCLCSRV